MTAATYIRNFITAHPSYRHDSAVPADTNYDLMRRLDDIEQGRVDAPGFLPPTYASRRRAALAHDHEALACTAAAPAAAPAGAGAAAAAPRATTPIPTSHRPQHCSRPPSADDAANAAHDVPSPKVMPTSLPMPTPKSKSKSKPTPNPAHCLPLNQS